MPRRPNPIPKLCRHKGTNQAYIRVDGKSHYLGSWDAPDRDERYRRAVGNLTAGKGVAGDDAPTIAEAAALYLERLDIEIRDNSDRVHARRALDELLKRHARLPAKDFGPRDLKAIMRDLENEGRLSRRTINRRVKFIRRIFKWWVGEGLVPPAVADALKAVDPLRAGKSTAPETPRRGPVAWEDVEPILDRLAPQVRAMIRLQWHTGMRPGEVVLMRTADVERPGPNGNWIYRPRRHKTARLGTIRRIPLGPRCQAILEDWLRDDEPDRHLFRPIDVMDDLRRSARARRASKARPSQANRGRKPDPRKAPGEHYTTQSYGRAVKTAIDAENRARAAAGIEPIKPWTPHQLRHAFATRAAAVNPEAARAMLGHRKIDMTAHYAAHELGLAGELADELG